MFDFHIVASVSNYTDEFVRESERNRTLFQLCNRTESFLCVVERCGYAIAVPCIACVGMMLNLFNLLVLLQARFKESSYTYLTNLAVADLLSLFFFAVNGIGRGHYPKDIGWRSFEVYAYFPCGQSTTTASIFLTVIVTVERFAFIYYPAQSKMWCRQSTARKISCAIWLCSIAVNIPRFFVMRVTPEGRLGFTRFGESEAYRYLSWAYFFVISLGTGLCLLIFNVLLIIGIRRTTTRRRMMMQNGSAAAAVEPSGDKLRPPPAVGGGGGSFRERQRERDEATLTRTLVVVVCVFIMGEMPSAFTSRSMIVALLGEDKLLLESAGYRIAVLVSTLLVVSQHSLNFIVYCVFNKRFCDALREQMPQKCGSRAGGAGPRGTGLNNGGPYEEHVGLRVGGGGNGIAGGGGDDKSVVVSLPYPQCAAVHCESPSSIPDEKQLLENASLEN